jgi:DNA-binding transcriptional LysR family regulator
MAKLDQIDLNALCIFDAVVEAGSFTGAADRLGVAKAKISVQIGRLEKQLGSSLFTRTTRQMNLTDQGRTLHEQCQPYLIGLRDALTQVGSAQSELTGVLRISASVMHAAQSVAPALAHFAKLHPHLRIDLRTNDRIVDLVADGIDLSFRMGWLRDSSQRAIKIGDFKQCVLAAPAYLKKCGTPQHPEDLREHEWVALSLLPTPLTWKFVDNKSDSCTVHMKSRLHVDSPSSLLALLQQGVGISVMEEMSAQAAIKSGKLRQVLPDWSLPSGGIYAVLPPGRHVPAKVRAFIDFYRDFMLP